MMAGDPFPCHSFLRSITMNTRKVILLCLVGLLLSTTAHAKIIFSSERNGLRGVYVMDDDGSNQTLLTVEKKWGPYPWSWSPDGTQILFKHRSALFLMNPDGTNIQQLTENDNSYIGRASFSPDGNFIVYDGSVKIANNDEKYVIKMLNIKTGNIEVISDLSVIQCDWSPDGKHIIFAEPLSPGRNGTIWIMGADGHNPRRLIPDPGPQADNFFIYRSRPRWSPNGQQIVFMEEHRKWEFVPNVGNMLVFKAFRYIICDRNGTIIKKLSIPKDWDSLSIDWMDDGNSVVFSAGFGIPMDGPVPLDFEWPPYNIYKYHIWTNKITRLTDHPGVDQAIDWISDDVLPVSPQGKKKVTWGKLKQ